MRKGGGGGGVGGGGGSEGDALLFSLGETLRSTMQILPSCLSTAVPPAAEGRRGRSDGKADGDGVKDKRGRAEQSRAERNKPGRRGGEEEAAEEKKEDRMTEDTGGGGGR